ncbi:pilus assembly FimT family protein [Cerasicoccus maritimus]|uniref:pilus assembly FimT family protein n=1 Tax=Cerasicoccus maritimus TaxID=490089 RepID=UPI0028529FE2|nr:prepilin-type N-terminal cleavage/methylation domain-containing protein [Cerasicoccus maritimus]
MKHIYQTELKHHRVHGGFSLVEIMIGMTILGLVMGASLLAIPEIRELNYQSDSMRSGFTVLNSELESLRTQTFDQLSESISGSSEEDDNSLLAKLIGISDNSNSVTTKSKSTLNNVDYSVVRELSFVDSAQEVIESTVTIEWSLGGRTKSVVGRAIFTKDGLSDKKFSTAN